jgi:hypothetical protein
VLVHCNSARGCVDLRLRRIKSLAGVRIISSVVDESTNSEEYENAYWAALEELAIQAETIQNAIRGKIREEYLRKN